MENIGSALKSIISRYGELKTNPNVLTDSEGEELSLNKVDTALQSVGISIHDAAGQFRNFDEVILELADSWDTIDKNTQRYIATIMAGNRQQSRFLALVSSGERLKELMKEASESEDAATLQVLKTMDSIAVKQQQLQTSLQGLYVASGLEETYKHLLDIGKNVIDTFANIPVKIAGIPAGAIFVFSSLFMNIAQLAMQGLARIKVYFDNQVVAVKNKVQQTSDQAGKSLEESMNRASAQAGQKIQSNLSNGITNGVNNAINLNSGLNASKFITPNSIKNPVPFGDSTQWYAKQAYANAYAKGQAGFAGPGVYDTRDYVNFQGYFRGGNIPTIKDDLNGKLDTSAESATRLGSAFGWIQSHSNGVGTALRSIGIAAQMAGMAFDTTTESGRALSTTLSVLGGAAATAGAIISQNYVMAAMMAVSTIITLISSIETAEKKAERLKKTAEDATNKALVSKDELKTLKQYKEKYDELYRVRNKDAESKQKWLDLNNEIVNKYPELLGHIDSEGNTIASLATSYDALYQAKLRAYNQAFVEDVKAEFDMYDNFDTFLRNLSLNDDNFVSSESVETYKSVIYKGLKDNFDAIKDGSKDANKVLEDSIGDYSPYALLRFGVLESPKSSDYEDTDVWDDAFSRYDYATRYGDLGEYSATDLYMEVAKQISEGKGLNDINQALAAKFGEGIKITEEFFRTMRTYVESFGSLGDAYNSMAKGKLGSFAGLLIKENNKPNSSLYQSMLTDQLVAAWNSTIKDNPEAKIDDFLNSILLNNGTEVLETTDQLIPKGVIDKLNNAFENLDQFASSDELEKYLEDKFKITKANNKDLVDKFTSEWDSQFGSFVDDSVEYISGFFSEGSFTKKDETTYKDMLNSLPAKYWQSVQDMLEQSLANIDYDPAGAEKSFNALEDIFLAVGEITDPEKQAKVMEQIESGDLTNLTGIYTLIDSLTSAGLITEGDEIDTALKTLKTTLDVNLVSEVDQMIYSLSNKVSDFTKALSDAQKGMELDDALNMAERLGKNITDFDFINGKYFYRNVEDIKEYYWDLINGLEEEVSGRITDDLNFVSLRKNGFNFVYESIFQSEDFATKTYDEQIDLLKTNSKMGEEAAKRYVDFYNNYYTGFEQRTDKNQSFSEYIIEQLINAQTNLDKIYTKYGEYTVNSVLITTGNLQSALEGIFGKENVPDVAQVLAYARGEKNNLTDEQKSALNEYLGLIIDTYKAATDSINSQILTAVKNGSATLMINVTAENIDYLKKLLPKQEFKIDTTTAIDMANFDTFNKYWAAVGDTYTDLTERGQQYQEAYTTFNEKPQYQKFLDIFSKDTISMADAYTFGRSQGILEKDINNWYKGLGYIFDKGTQQYIRKYSEDSVEAQRALFNSLIQNQNVDSATLNEAQKMFQEYELRLNSAVASATNDIISNSTDVTSDMIDALAKSLEGIDGFSYDQIVEKYTKQNEGQETFTFDIDKFLKDLATVQEIPELASAKTFDTFSSMVSQMQSAMSEGLDKQEDILNLKNVFQNITGKEATGSIDQVTGKWELTVEEYALFENSVENMLLGLGFQSDQITAMFKNIRGNGLFSSALNYAKGNTHTEVETENLKESLIQRSLGDSKDYRRAVKDSQVSTGYAKEAAKERIKKLQDEAAESADKLISTLDEGGAAAVQALEKLAKDFEEVLSPEDIEAVYYKRVTELQSWGEKIRGGIEKGAIVADEGLRGLLKNHGYTFDENGVVLSVGDAQAAYKAIMDQMAVAAGHTTSDLNALWAAGKQVEESTRKTILGAVSSTEGLSADIVNTIVENYNKLHKTLYTADNLMKNKGVREKFGLTLDEQGNLVIESLDQYLAAQLGDNFEQFKGTDQYRETVKAYYEAKNKLDRSLADGLISEINTLQSSKIGDKINVTNLVSLFGEENLDLLDIFGDAYDDAKQTITNTGNINFYQSLSELLVKIDEMGETIPDGVSELLISILDSMEDSALSEINSLQVGSKISKATIDYMKNKGLDSDWMKEVDANGNAVINSIDELQAVTADAYAILTEENSTVSERNKAFIQLVKANQVGAARVANTLLSSAGSGFSFDTLSTFFDSLGIEINTIIDKTTGEVKDGIEAITKTGIDTYEVVGTFNEFLNFVAEQAGFAVENITDEQRRKLYDTFVSTRVSRANEPAQTRKNQISGLFTGEIGQQVQINEISGYIGGIVGETLTITNRTLSNLFSNIKNNRVILNPNDKRELMTQYYEGISSAMSEVASAGIGSYLSATTSAVLVAFGQGKFNVDENGRIVIKSASEYLDAVSTIYITARDSFEQGRVSLNELNNSYLNVIQANNAMKSAGLSMLTNASNFNASAINSFVGALGGALETILTDEGDVQDAFKKAIARTGVDSYEIADWTSFMGVYAAATGEFFDETSKEYINAYAAYLSSQQAKDPTQMLASVLPKANALDYTQIGTIAQALGISVTEVLNHTYENLDGTLDATEYLLEQIKDNDYLKSLIQPAAYDNAISAISDLGATQTSGINSMATMIERTKTINEELHLANDKTVDELFEWNDDLHAYVYTAQGIQYSIELARVRLAQAGKEEKEINKILTQQAGYDFLGNLDITGFISGGFKQSDWDKIESGLVNYTTAILQLGGSIPEWADLTIASSRLLQGGDEAVKEIQRIYSASGREITSEEIVAAYRGEVEAIKKLEVNLGDTIDAETAKLLGLEVEDGANVYVVQSIQDLITAYTNIYHRLSNSGEATLQEINAAGAKVLTAQDQDQINAISAMQNAFGMTWDTLGDLFAQAGKNMITELEGNGLTNYGLERTGAGGVNILDFQKFAEQMEWAPDSKEYLSAFKAYNNSLIEYNKKVESEIVSEVGNLGNLKVGEQFNVTYLMDALSNYGNVVTTMDQQLANTLTRYGITIENGILEVTDSSHFNAQDALKVIAKYLGGINNNGQYNEIIQSLVNSIMSVVPTAISELSSVDFNKPLTGTTAELLSKSSTWKAEFERFGTATITSAEQYAEACKLVYQTAQESFDEGLSNITTLNSAYKQLINSQVVNVERTAKMNVLKSANSLNLDTLESFFNDLGLVMSDYVNVYGGLTQEGKKAGFGGEQGNYKIVDWAKFRASFAGILNERSDEYIDAYISYLSSSETEGINTKEAFMASLIPSLNKLTYAQVGEIAKRFDLTVEEVVAMLEDNGDGTFNGNALYNELDFDKNNEAVQKAYTEAIKGYASGLSSAIINWSAAMNVGGANRAYAAANLEKAIEEYTKGMQSLGQAVEINTQYMYDILSAGGEEAVQMAQKIAALAGATLSESDISTLYYGQIDELISAIEKVSAEAGEIVDKTTADIIREAGGKVNQLGTTGQYVVESAANLLDAYRIIYERLVESGKGTTSQLNNLVAKQLELKRGSDAISALGDAASMTYTRFGEILAEQGIELTEELISRLENDNLIKSLGGGKMAIIDFDAFADVMKWDKNSAEYVSAFKTYNDAMISMNKQVEKNILEEVKNVANAKPGDQINLTQLVSTLTEDQLGELQTFLAGLGAYLNDGILTLFEGANITAIIQTLAQQAQEHGGLIASEMAELADTLESTLKNYASLIQTGLNGSLTNVQAQQLQQWAANNNVDLTFTRTANGLKMSRDSAWELYEALNKIDSIQAESVFDAIVNSYSSETGGVLQSSNDTLAEVAKLQKQIATNEEKIEQARNRIKTAEEHPEKAILSEIASNEQDRINAIESQNDRLREQVGILNQIASAQASNPDSFKFMDNALPSNLQGPMNYWNALGKMFTSMNTAATSGKMDMQDFYNIVNEFSNLAAMSRKEIMVGGIALDGSASRAAELITKGFGALQNIDGKGVMINLKDIGVDFSAGATDMRNGVLDGVHKVAESQIALLDAAIQMLEVIVAMEDLGDIDLEGNGLDFKDVFGKGDNGFTEGYNRWLEKVGLLDPESELSKFAKSIQIGSDTLYDVLTKSAEELELGQQEQLAVIQSLYDLYANGDFDLNNIQDSVLKAFQNLNLPEDFSINIGDGYTIGFSGGVQYEIDWNNSKTKAAEKYLEEQLKEEEGDGKKAFEEAVRKVNSGEATRVEYTSYLISTGDIEVSDDGTTYTFPDGTKLTSESSEAEWQAAFTKYYFDKNKKNGAEKVILDDGTEGTSTTVETHMKNSVKQIVSFDAKGNKKTIYRVVGDDGTVLGEGESPRDAYMNAFKNSNIYEDIELESLSAQDQQGYMNAAFESWMWATFGIRLKPDYKVTDDNGKEVKLSDPSVQRELYESIMGGEGYTTDNDEIIISGFHFKIQTDETPEQAYQRIISELGLDYGLAASVATAIQTAFEGDSGAQIARAMITGIITALTTQEGLDESALEGRGKEITSALAEGMKADLSPIIEASTVIANTIKETIIAILGGFNPFEVSNPEDSNPETPTPQPAPQPTNTRRRHGVTEYTDSGSSGGKVTPQKKIDRLEVNTIDVTNSTSSNGLSGDTATEDGISEKLAGVSDYLNNMGESASGAEPVLDQISTDLSTIPTNGADPITEAASALQQSLTAGADAISKAVNAISSIKDTSASINNVKKAIGALDGLKANVTIDIAVTGGEGLGGATGNVKLTTSGGGELQRAVGDKRAVIKTKSYAKGTLMGELGRELVVSGGRYYTVGDSGPEMVDLPQDAIVFNHLQTASLLNNGYTKTHGKPVTNERKATAFAKGSVEGPAKASASAALAALKELRAQWQALLGASLRDLGAMGGGSGGGGGGGGDNKFYDGVIEDVEQWYNWLRKIERLQEDINILTKEYSVMEKNFEEKSSLYDNLVTQAKAQLEILATTQDLTARMWEEYEKKLAAIQEGKSPLSGFYEVDAETQQLLIKNNEGFLEFIQSRGEVDENIRAALAAGVNTVQIKAKKVDEEGKFVKDKKGNPVLEDVTITIPTGGLDFLNEVFGTDAYGEPKYTAAAQFAIIRQLGLGEEFLQYDENGKKLFDTFDSVTEEQMQAAVESWLKKIEGGKDSIDDMRQEIDKQTEASLSAKQAIQSLNENIDKLYEVTEGVVKSFEDYYNWTLLVNENQKNLNKLTKDYTLLQKDFIANGKAMFTNLMDQVDALIRQRDTNERFMSERQAQQEKYMQAISDDFYKMFLQVDEATGRTYLTGDTSFASAIASSALASEEMRAAAQAILRGETRTFNLERTRIKTDEFGNKLDEAGNIITDFATQIEAVETSIVSIDLPQSAQGLMDMLLGQNKYKETNLSADEQFEILRQMGFLPYMRFDENGKQIFSDLQSITDAEKSKAVETLIAKIQTMLADSNNNLESINKLAEEIQGINSSLLQVQEQLNQVVNQVNNDLKEAIVAERQELIDKLTEEKEAIQDAADKFTTGLTDALNKERQLYNNDKDEKDLRKLQGQLALAQRSGADLSTIRNYQQQIQSKQRDMYFDERQQQIDAIKEASDKQIEKLEDQIEIMTETLDYQVKNGLIWSQVYEMLDTQNPDSIAAYISAHNADYQAGSIESQEAFYRSALENLQIVQAMASEADKLSYLKTVLATITDIDGVLDTKLSEVFKDVEAPIGEISQSIEEEQQETSSTYEKDREAAYVSYAEWYKNNLGEDSIFTKYLYDNLYKLPGDDRLVAERLRDIYLKAYDDAVEGTDRGFNAAVETNKELNAIFAQYGNFYQPQLATSLENVANALANSNIEELRKGLLNNVNLNASMMNNYTDVLSDFTDALNDFSARDEGIYIDNVAINMNVEQMNSDYDAKRAGEQVLEEMVRIARKTGTRSISRR